MSKDLIIGYGNPDREDDGVAWFMLLNLLQRFDRKLPEDEFDGIYPTGESPDFLFELQLTPEMSEMLAEYDRVCFIDAHTGNVPDDLNWQIIKSEYTASPFTHHLTPNSLMAMTKALYNHNPEAVLVSVRGFNFGFSHDLSSRTEKLAQKAVEMILKWLNKS